MATHDHSEAIRLQAERVISAYKELRADKKNADFKSDEFPVGLFAELITQLQQLDIWLEQAADDDTEADEQQAIAAAWKRQKAAGMHQDIAETNIEHALRAIDRADRLLNVCRTSVQALDVEHSADTAHTMGSELWEALDEARKALKGNES